MRVTRVKIRLRPPETIFEEAATVLTQLEAGKQVPAQPAWLYCSDVRAMEKVLTSKRLEFLKTLPNHHPESVQALTALMGWHVKNMAEALGLLVSLGVVEMREDGGARLEESPDRKLRDAHGRSPSLRGVGREREVSPEAT
jgi:predicted transcriptional regulator